MALPPLFTAAAHSTSQLSEFVATMVYVIWHARKTAKLPDYQSVRNNTDLAYLMWQARKPVTKAAYSPLEHSLSSYTASPAFKKFCFQVLTATQLQESTVYLSLKYITILLQSNPSIEGAEGSEYRLFIVALMLANKFLDDATFTNKTWSEVSGMKVHDLNIMEAEFLEALEYNLHIGEHEYSTWKHLLEECRDRTHMSYYDSPQQQQRLVLMTLKTLGLYDNDHKKLEQQFCDWDARYQHYNIPKMDHQSAYLLPPPVGYYVYVNEYPSCTNLSQSSWDPLAYSLASCQDISLQHYQFNSRSFPWSNSTTWT